MNSTLFIGNGINRLENDNISYADIIQQFSNSYNVLGSVTSKFDKFKPLPMLLEQIVLSKNGDYELNLKTLKELLSKKLSKLVPNQFHSDILRCKFDSILTTNYDYCFEMCIGVPIVQSLSDGHETTESKYSLFRKRVFPDEKLLWHIHGELNQEKGLNKNRSDYPEKNIMIGYDHYVEYLYKIQDYLRSLRKVNASDDLFRIFQTSTSGSWVSNFFNSDISICGLEMAYSELDLWWLFNLRAKVLKENGSIERQNQANKITFYYPKFPEITFDEIKNNAELLIEYEYYSQFHSRMEILKSMFVEIVPIFIEKRNDYHEFWKVLLRDHLPK